MRKHAIAHSILFVGRVSDAQRMGAMSNPDETQHPHFHCTNLDAGLLGQIFWDASKIGAPSGREFESIQLVYSQVREGESIFVHALPPHVSQQYARMNDADLDECASRWFSAHGHIRMPSSQEFHRRVMKELSRLARLALETDQTLLVRTHYRRSHKQQ